MTTAGQWAQVREAPRLYESTIEHIFSLTVERDTELRAMRSVLESARAGVGASALLEGPSGIGKSRLLQDIEGHALRENMTVLRAAGGELERDHPFGVVIRLFERMVLDDTGGLAAAILQGRARLAAPLFADDHDVVRPLAPTDEFALLHGLYWCLVNLTETSPVALIVDDIQWVDDQSLRFLAYLAQRLRGLPLALIAAVRTDGPDPERIYAAHLLDAIDEGVHCQPRELSLSAIAALLARADPSLGQQPELAEAAWRSTKGNPFLVRELIAAVEETDQRWTGVTAERLEQFAPQSVSRRVILRLAHIGEDGLGLARAAAVLGDDTALVAVAQLIGADLGSAAMTAHRLMAAHIWASTDPVRFVHPVTRAAIYESIPGEDKVVLHKRAAWYLREQRAGADLVAAHLLVASPSPEPWVRQALHEGAQLVARKGAPGTAARYLRRALEMSDPAHRDAELLLDLALVEAAAGETTSIHRFVEAVETVDTPARRIDALYALGQTLFRYGRHAEAAAAFRRGVDLFRGSDADTALMFESALLCCAHYLSPLHQDSTGRLASIVSEIQQRGERGDVARSVLGVAALYWASDIPPAGEAARLARLALEGGQPRPGRSPESIEANLSMVALVWSGHPDEVLDPAEQALSSARRTGSVLAFADASFVRAMALHRMGRIPEAMVDAEAAVEGTRRGWRATAPAPHALLADCQVESADLVGAQRTIDDAETVLAGFEARGPNSWFHWARGRLRYAAGDLDGALADQMRAGQILAAYGMTSPSIMPWRTRAAQAAIATGDRPLAARLLKEELAATEAFDLPVQHAAARSLYATMQDDGGIAGHQDAVTVLRAHSASLELARALKRLGVARREQGDVQGARATLRESLDQAHQCGALFLEQRVHAELLASGARPRRARSSGADALTPSERRVVELAVQGATNRAIAEILFLTKNTVEWHLRNAYRKLGVSSRERLIEVMAAAGVFPEMPDGAGPAFAGEP